MLCLAACAAKNQTITQKIEGEWVCDANATWLLWNPGKKLVQDVDFKAMQLARLRLDLQKKQMIMWNERFGKASEVTSPFAIVRQTPTSITIDDGDVLELRDPNTLFIHDPQNPQKGFIFKRK